MDDMREYIPGMLPDAKLWRNEAWMPLWRLPLHDDEMLGVFESCTPTPCATKEEAMVQSAMLLPMEIEYMMSMYDEIEKRFYS